MNTDGECMRTNDHDWRKNRRSHPNPAGYETELSSVGKIRYIQSANMTCLSLGTDEGDTKASSRGHCSCEICTRESQAMHQSLGDGLGRIWPDRCVWPGKGISSATSRNTMLGERVVPLFE